MNALQDPGNCLLPYNLLAKRYKFYQNQKRIGYVNDEKESRDEKNDSHKRGSGDKKSGQKRSLPILEKKLRLEPKNPPKNRCFENHEKGHLCKAYRGCIMSQAITTAHQAWYRLYHPADCSSQAGTDSKDVTIATLRANRVSNP